MKATLFLCLLALFGLPALHAQEADSSNINEDERFRPLGDTTRVFFRTPTQPYPQEVDTSLNDFEYANHLQQRYDEYRHLGNYGSPHFPLFFDTHPQQGIRLGLEQYRLYRLRPEDFPRYISPRPFTELFYSQATQRNSNVAARFGQQLQPRFYYGIEYSLINQLGLYQSQEVRNQNIGVQLFFQSKSSRYEGRFVFVQHNILQENNGGLTDNAVAQLQSGPVPFLENLGVQMSGRTESREQEAVYRQRLYNGLRSDSVYKASGYIEHQIGLRSHSYKFYDQAPPSDSSFYGNFQTNNRGLRLFLQGTQLRNEIRWVQAFGKLNRAPLELQVGGAHRFWWINQEPNRRRLQSLEIEGLLQSNPRLKLPFRYRLQGSGVVADNQIDLQVQADLAWEKEGLGQLRGALLWQRYRPSLMQGALFVSQTAVWENDFNSIQSLSLRGELRLDALKWSQTELRGSYHLLQNWIYFDSLRLPQQYRPVQSVLQGSVAQHFHLGKFHSRTQFTLQVLPQTDLLRFPTWWLEQQLYYQSPFFRGLLLRIGVNLRYHAPFFGERYFPLTGQFHLQNSQELLSFPQVDAYVSFKVWQFRFFLNFENAAQPVLQQNYFAAPGYGMPNARLRLGVRWRLFD